MVDQITARDAAGLEDVIRSAARLADQVRELVTSAGSVTEREVAMLATIAEDVRDRVIAAERLKVAREDGVLAGFRRSTHRAVDLGFDLVGTVVTAATDALDAFINTPRGVSRDVQPVLKDG
jgi:hypothetical protein